MHLEILVEDLSGEKALSILMPKIIGNVHTFRIHSYKGAGRIPKDLRGTSDPEKRILLDRLPKLLRGYGKTFANYPEDQIAIVVVVCDLDDKCLHEFRKELLKILNQCNPKPKTLFCFAVEEGEAWILGDMNAIIHSYPTANEAVLNSYENDSICGTWEKLADAIYSGGARKLKSLGYPVIGIKKCEWVERIAPQMDVTVNKSPSFCYFVRKINEWAEK